MSEKWHWDIQKNCADKYAGVTLCTLPYLLTADILFVRGG